MRTSLLTTAFSALLASAAFSADQPPAIDPNALAPLKQMSQTLAAAPAFTFRSNSIVEVPAATGQFITLFSKGKIAVKRPDKVRAELAGSAPNFDFYYDGTNVSAFAEGPNEYSITPAPNTIDTMFAGLQSETGIRFAAAPLLTSNPYAALTRGLTSAVIVGPTEIDGTLCTHLAFRAPGTNWEIWLESNADALPRRLAVTFTDRENFPRTVVEFSAWNLHPWFLADSSFTFEPPSGASEIPFVSVLKAADR